MAPLGQHQQPLGTLHIDTLVSVSLLLGFGKCMRPAGKMENGIDVREKIGVKWLAVQITYRICIPWTRNRTPPQSSNPDFMALELLTQRPPDESARTRDQNSFHAIY